METLLRNLPPQVDHQALHSELRKVCPVDEAEINQCLTASLPEKNEHPAPFAPFLLPLENAGGSYLHVGL
eukprot:CAMPEP_0180370164 /NCGR_PEP_ID=MMETSP0989-20121125/18882_1 /TAXON_ID=697907 /ORGANISM="non described non described, Strain CCMP2293" /LENGTH=69 /DNA_ID=CAMNT_0022365587 /DNA_START=1 /DNA_END=210 /DNA_ORIENTATION=-